MTNVIQVNIWGHLSRKPTVTLCTIIILKLFFKKLEKKTIPDKILKDNDV